MSLVESQIVFLRNVAKLILYAESIGYELIGGELWRSSEQQKIYLQNGQTKYTYSRHQDRLAIDLNLVVNGKSIVDTEAYKPLGEYWRALNKYNIWGGDWNRNSSQQDERFSDGTHFEMLK